MKPYLFIGLGNVGVKYVNTRHNIGFDIVDAIADEFNCVFSETRFALLSDFRYRGRTIYLIKPTTYMNLSGRAFRYYINEFSIPLNHTLTIVDDLALPFGKIRLKGKGSHAGHNGLRNIQEEIGSNQFPRLRFGIGDDFSKGKQVDYVLSQWKSIEQEELPSYIQEAKRAALHFVAHGLSNTMNAFN